MQTVSIILTVFTITYNLKTVDFTEVSSQQRTTTAYFLNHGRWSDSALQDTLKNAVIQVIYQEAQRSGLVLVYKSRQKKLNSLYYHMKE